MSSRSLRDCSYHNKTVTTKLRQRARRATAILHDTYGSPRHGNKGDPLDELIFIVLSQMTTYQSFNRVYDRLRGSINTWEDLLEIPLSKLREFIKDAGLSYLRGTRLKEILRRITKDFGMASLDTLRDMSNAEVEEYLISLPGVGLKTAKCIMMYSLDRKVLPVDTHVWRVARRLGLLGEDVPYNKVHKAIEETVPPDDRYAFHVNAISHGREVCVHSLPYCSRCPLKRICKYPRTGAPHR